MIFGVLGPLVVLVHSGTHFHALVPIAAMLTMGVVVVSGIVGQALHYLAFREVNDHRRELVAKGYRRRTSKRRSMHWPAMKKRSVSGSVFMAR